MKAVRFHEHGGTDKLVYEDCPDPKPGAGQALIQVKAAALNRLDLWVRQGSPSYPVALPHIPGADVAGVVLEGDELGKIKPGDEVIVYPVVSCGQCKACTDGFENHCASFKLLGGHIPGGYAQKVVVPSRNLVKKPAGLSWAQAAAFPITYLTAWNMLAERAKLQKGETVLVLGASAGVSVAGIQIAQQLGARVIAHTSTPEKAEAIRALGVETVLSCHPSELSVKVLAATGNEGVDVVLEHVGPATWQQSMQSVARNGRIVTCGATTGAEVNLILRQLFMRELTVLGAYAGSLAQFHRVAQLLTQGKLLPLVYKTWPLAEAAQAQEALLARDHVGKLVLEVPE
jgi:NADPH:quinone reductase-like Zn-dependent oxidoreductase